MSRKVHNSAVELASPLFRRKRKRGNTVFSSSAGLQPFSIVGRRYSAGSSRLFSPFFSDRFERRKMVYVGSSIQHKTASDAVFAEYGFTWDAGNRITEFETVDGTAEYTYDKTGQLTGADYDYITDELYTYDDNGNRTNAGYVTGENNETLSDGTYRYSYDAEGNRTEKFLWTDTNNDGIIDDSEKTLVQTYNWDYRNRLESVTNYENGIAKEVIDYLYDYLNLMIERTITDAATSALQSSDFNIYSNGQVVLEYDTTSSIDVVKSVNLWGANIDELVAVEQMAQSVNDNNVILWTYSDHLNSIRDIVLYDSIDQTAAVVNHLIYSAFGVLVSSTDGNSNNPTSISPLLKFRYTGKFFDDSTGLQNNINRWYDNTMGKWLSVDPIGFKGGDINLYRYAGNRIKSDTNGLFNPGDYNSIDNSEVFEIRAFYYSNLLVQNIYNFRENYYNQTAFQTPSLEMQFDNFNKESLYIEYYSSKFNEYKQSLLPQYFNDNSSIPKIGAPNNIVLNPQNNSDEKATQNPLDLNNQYNFEPKYDESTKRIIAKFYYLLSSQYNWMAEGSVDPKTKIDKQLCGIPERLKGYNIGTFYPISIWRIDNFDDNTLIVGPTYDGKLGAFMRGNVDSNDFLYYQLYYTVGIKDLEQAIRNHNLQFEQEIGFEIFNKDWFNTKIFYKLFGQEENLGTGIILSW